jgi:hypothetical protein
MRASTKIVIGFAALCAGSYFGYQAYAERELSGLKFSELTPGRVNLVGIDTDKGYKIRVANQMAQLVEGVDYDFASKGSGQEDAAEGTGKRRIPIKELLDTLRGNEASLGRLVMIMNDRQENESWPPRRVYWEEADLRKALAGDKVLERKLVSDLNMELDGTPLPKLRIRSLEDGIIVRAKVPIQVSIKGVEKTLYGTIETPYKPRLMSTVEKSYEDKPNASETDQIGYYVTESRAVIADPTKKENVRKALEAYLDKNKLAELKQRPEQILRSAKVVLNESFIPDATYTTSKNADGGVMHQLSIKLSDEGRKRLWQYSRKKVGTQLLLIVDGIAIAAPRIGHELSQGDLTITQLPDEVLVREAVAGIKGTGN